MCIEKDLYANTSCQSPVKHNSINVLRFQLTSVNIRHTGIIVWCKSSDSVLEIPPLNAKYWGENWSILTILYPIKDAVEAAGVCIETIFYLLLVSLFLHGGYRCIISHRASVSSDILGHCQAEVAASAADLSRRVMWTLIQAGNQVTWTGSDLFHTLILHGLRKAHTILPTSTTVRSHKLLCSGTDEHLGSNVLAVWVSKVTVA